MPRNTTERQLELLIKWKKYDHSEDTWEPLYDLYDDIKNLSRDYFKGKGLAIIHIPKAKKPCDRFALQPLPKKTKPEIKKEKKAAKPPKEPKPRQSTYKKKEKVLPRPKYIKIKVPIDKEDTAKFLNSLNNEIDGSVSATISEHSLNNPDDLDMGSLGS